MEWSVFKAVEESILEAVRQNGNEFWNDLHAARIRIGNSYSDKGLSTQNATSLPFCSDAQRWAYAHLYVTAHTHMVKDILGLLWISKAPFRMWHSKLQGGLVRVCCVGGGPGSDLLGLAIFIRLHHLNVSLMQGDVLDQWTEWEDTFRSLIRHLDPLCLVLPSGGRGINYRDFHFHQVWWRNTHSWNNLQRIREANLVTMVKFVSAVAANKDECEDKLTVLLQLMKDGALLFFLDNAGGGYAKIICSAAANAGLYQIGKIEHVDVALPDNEGECINSSKLRMVKINTQKTWKVSAFLWQKGPIQSTGKRQKQQQSKKPSSFTNQNANYSNPHLPTSSSLQNGTSRLYITPQTPNLNLPQPPSCLPGSAQQSRPPLTYSAAVSANNENQLRVSQPSNVAQQSRTSLLYASAQPANTTSTQARTQLGTQTSRSTLINSSTDPGNTISTEVSTSQPRPTTYGSIEPQSQYKYAASTSYQNYYPPTPAPKLANVTRQPHSVVTGTSHSTGHQRNVTYEEKSVGCCGSILTCFGI